MIVGCVRKAMLFRPIPARPKTRGRAAIQPIKGALEIHFRRRSMHARNALSVDFLNEPIPRPPLLQILRLHETVETVIGVNTVVGNCRDAQKRMARADLGQRAAMCVRRCVHACIWSSCSRPMAACISNIRQFGTDGVVNQAGAGRWERS